MAHNIDQAGTLSANDVRVEDVIPVRPRMPTKADQDRALHSEMRWRVLKEDWDDLLADWLAEHVDEERLTVWGPPDTSSNSLADVASQLSTPGLYGKRPIIQHRDLIAQTLVGEGGFLDEAGLWTKLQQVQYFSIGLGDCLLRFDALQDQRRLSVRIVFPHNVYTASSGAEPDEAIELWELRLRWWDDKDKWVWTWDQFRLHDKLLDGAPSYRIVLAETDAQDAKSGDSRTDNMLRGVDVSNVFLGTERNLDGDFTGDRYPFIDPAKGPYIPYSTYRAVDSGELWNAHHKRGAFRGTLNAGMNWTYTQHAARDASGSAVLAVGIDVPAANVRHGGDGFGQRARAESLILTPGAIVYHQASEGASQSFFQEIGPGGNLTDLSAYANLYEQKQAVRWGLNPSDLTRVTNNPQSGAALFVSSKGRREFARQLEPLFRRADLRSIRISSLLLSAASIATLPVDGYSIQYAEIPESPEEERSGREALDWDIEHGVITQVELLQVRRPGTTKEDALASIVKSSVEKRQIDALVAEELGRLGLIDENEAPATRIEEEPIGDDEP